MDYLQESNDAFKSFMSAGPHPIANLMQMNNRDLGEGFTQCPKCGAMSVKRGLNNVVFCWYNETCCWNELSKAAATTDKASGLSSHDYFVKMMGI